MLNSKLHYKSRIKYNYSNNNDILELLMAYSVVIDGEFLLELCEFLVNHKCGT